MPTLLQQGHNFVTQSCSVISHQLCTDSAGFAAGLAQFLVLSSSYMLIDLVEQNVYRQSGLCVLLPIVCVSQPLFEL